MSPATSTQSAMGDREQSMETPAAATVFEAVQPCKREKHFEPKAAGSATRFEPGTWAKVECMRQRPRVGRGPFPPRRSAVQMGL